MIAAAHDEGNSLGDGHAGDLAFMGQFECPFHGRRGLERHAVRHRQIGDAALPGQHGAVGHKGHQLFLFQDMADCFLILCKEDRPLYLSGIQSGIEQAVLHTAGEEIEQNLVQLARVDGAPEGREAYMETDCQTVLRDFTGAALQHCLPAAADGKQAAFSGAFCLEIVLLKLLAHLSDQVIL